MSKFTQEDYMWIIGIGFSLIIYSFFKINILQFVGLIFITRGLIGIIFHKKKQEASQT